MIDIISIYQKYNIKYWTEGKNVQPGWINIQCPFCDDHSNHLGFNVEKQYYFCWKCEFKFKDKVFYKLNIPLTELDNHVYVNLEIIKKLNIEKVPFVLPGKPGLNKRAKEYLIKRNFDPDLLIEKYDLHYCDHLSKNYNFRIIIPIYFQNKIISYTTRDYTNKQELRYVSCSRNMEIIDHKNILYNVDNCKKKYIFVFEGNFDAWRMGDDGCSSFGTIFTMAQVNLLCNYETIIIVFDSDDEAQKEAEKLGNLLSGLGKNVYVIRPHKKDFALFSQKEANKYKKEILKQLNLI
jgi:hypothetical protein